MSTKPPALRRGRWFPDRVANGVMQLLKPDKKRFLQLLRHGMLHLHVFRLLTSLLRHFGTSNLLLMFRKDLTQPLTPYAAKVPIDIGVARDVDMDEVAVLYHHNNPGRVARRARWFRERIKNDNYCFVARVDGAIVAYNWIRIRTAYGAHDETMRLKDDETYQTDAYTGRPWRGKGIHTALNYAMLQYSQDCDYRTAYTMMRVENTRSWVTMVRVGWQLSGTLFYFRAKRALNTPIWLVAGSAYPMPIKSGRRKKVTRQRRVDYISNRTTGAEFIETGVFDWVRKYYRFERCDEIRRRPWSKTYRLTDSNDEHATYLKLVPRERANALRAQVILAGAYPDNMPRVVACNREKGWMLTLDHGGEKLDYDAPEQHLFELIETYARLQCRAMSNSGLLASLSSCKVSSALPELLDFLRSDKSPSTTGHGLRADYFIGPRYAESYYAALMQYRPLLEDFIAPAKQLQETLNHGGLRPTNAAVTASGKCVLYSWDNATAGPAGLSLHALFRGCTTPHLLLSGNDAVSEGSFYGRLLARYINALVKGGYADEQTLRQCLPATITIGVMQYLSSITQYPTEQSGERRSIATKLKRRLRDLLDLCDCLASKDRQTALAFSQHYRQHENPRRARIILERYLTNNSNDAVAQGRLAEILTEQGEFSKAQAAYGQSLALDPEQAELHNALGSIYLRELQFDKAAACFQRALELKPDFDAARANADRAVRHQRSWERIRLMNHGKRV